MKATLKIHSRFRDKLEKKAKAAVAAAMVRGVSKVIDVLGRAADAKLHRTSRLYRDLLPEAVTATSTSIEVNMDGILEGLEKGYPGRDMKPALLASANAKTSKDGTRYVDVPFQHAALRDLPAKVQGQIKSVLKTERTSARWQGRDVRNPLRVTGDMPADNRRHTTSIYSNMIRTAKPKQQKAAAAYQTIRRVSSKSDPKSWRHPGFEGVRALRRVKAQILTALRALFVEEARRRGLKAK